MAGLANLLIGGLLGSQMFGGKEKEQQPQMKGGWSPPNQQQPTQVASNDTQQGQGGGFGFGGIVSGFSNSIFKGMSEEQVARLGIGFNSMRLRPDDNMAASFQTKINRLRDEAKLTKTTNATIEYLQNATSTQFPNGRVDLIDMLKKGIITPTQALDHAMKVVKPSALAEKFTKYQDLSVKYKGSENIPDFELQLLGITDNEVNSIKEFQFYQEGGGKLDYMSFLARGDNKAATSIEEFEYYKKTTKDNPPMDYKTFLQSKSDNISISTNSDPEGYTPFWKKVDEDYAARYNEWTESVGADTKGNVVKLQEVLRALKSGKKLTGSVIGSMPDFINKFLNPDVTQAREAVESVVQRNLKAILGAQFTEKEGERLISRAYNPKLSPQMNAQRLEILVTQMLLAVQAEDDKAEFVRKHGTLMGWTGELASMDDFWTAISANQVGDIVCNNGQGADRQCFAYKGGDETIDSNWILQE